MCKCLLLVRFYPLGCFYLVIMTDYRAMLAVLKYGMLTAIEMGISNNVMEKRMVVTVNDYKRLNGLVEFSQAKSKVPLIVDKLISGLKNARMFPQEDIPGNVVTMNSRVLLTEITSGRQSEITISYPDDADSIEGRVSILSPVGVALLGKSQGHIASWRIPGGWGEFRIERVTYQPEAAGHYYL